MTSGGLTGPPFLFFDSMVTILLTMPDEIQDKMKAFIQQYGREFVDGTVLFQEGDYGDTVFVIHKGKVKITKKVRNIEKTLALLGKGEFFGEMAVLDNKPRSATAEVAEDSMILVLDGKTFEAFLLNNSPVAVKLIKKLVQRLREADDQIENLMIRDSESKVVNTLIKMVPDTGVPTTEGVQLAIKGDDLMVKVGLSRENLKEVLGKLKIFGLIRVSNKKIVIPSLHKLNRYSKFLEMKEEFARRFQA